MGIDIGMNIKTIRLAKGFSQNALSKKAGIGQSTLSYIESGKKHPQFDTLSAICIELETTVLELLSYNEQQSNIKLFEEQKEHYKTLELAISTNLPEFNRDFERYLYEKYKRINDSK